MGFEDELVEEPSMVDGFYQTKGSLNYTKLLFYEKKFFSPLYVDSKRIWMLNNWHLSVVIAVIYIVSVYAGQHFMKNRPKFELRRCLIAWNFFLAAFSIIGSIRVWPEFYNTIVNKGFGHSVCDNDCVHGVLGCWGWLFILSKVPELIDTLFIILRKQELIFLHWYHHATVLVYCWYAVSEFTASGRWFVLMNYTVHSAMYTYYGFRALRFKIPKWVNIVITTGQISQMFIGIIVNTVAYIKKSRGDSCDISYENIKWSFFMYFTYFLLFFNFFYNAYIVKSRKSQIDIKSGDLVNDKIQSNGVNNGHVKSIGTYDVKKHAD